MRERLKAADQRTKGRQDNGTKRQSEAGDRSLQRPTDDGTRHKQATRDGERQEKLKANYGEEAKGQNRHHD